MADDDVMELEFRVDGLAEPGRAEQVRDIVRGLDPQARVDIDPHHQLARIATSRQALEITDALAKTGLNPTAMTG